MPTSTGRKPAIHTKKHLARQERERRQTQWILYIFVAILVAVAGLLAYGYLDVNYFQNQQPVAKVGDVEILTKDFKTRVYLERQSLVQQYMQYQQYQQFGIDVSSQLQQIQAKLNSPVDIGQTVIDQMINEQLIRLEAKKRNIIISPDEIEARVRDTFGYFPDGTPTQQSTPTEFATPTLMPESKALITKTPTQTAIPSETPTTLPSLPPTLASNLTPEQTPSPQATATLEPSATPSPTLESPPTSAPTLSPTPYTLEGFTELYKKNLEQYAILGLTEDQYRALFEINLLREKLFEVITADVKAEQEQVWARHILVTTEEEAKAVIERLKKGEDFATVALEVSKDTGNAQSGGDLGWFGRDAMVKPFEDASFSLKVGEISAPVKSDFGFHVIQVLGHQERPLDAQQYDTARNTVFQKWLEEAHTTYGVETFDWQSRVPTDDPVAAATGQSQ